MAEQRRWSQSSNHILFALPLEDYHILTPLLAPMEFRSKQKLEEGNRKVDYAYFLDTGLISLVATRGRRHTEVALIGPEGMTGSQVILGEDRSTFYPYVIVDGFGWRIAISDLRHVIKTGLLFRSLVQGFANSLLIQVGHTALANAQGTVEQRIARWLLMASDRMMQDEVSVTHEILAFALSVTRPGVTVALGKLEVKGVLTNGRQCVRILDRNDLIRCAGGLYGTSERERLPAAEHL